MRMQSILVRPHVLDCLGRIESEKRAEEERKDPSLKLKPKSSFIVNSNGSVTVHLESPFIEDEYVEDEESQDSSEAESEEENEVNELPSKFE